jgi:DNA-directed RNA polymerase beta subunit
MAFASNPRKTHQFLPSRGKQFLPRAVHGSHYGFICPAETPSGDSIGYTKTPSQTCEYTIRGNEPAWVNAIAKITDPWSPGDERVMLNGRILGRPRGPLKQTFEILLLEKRRDPHAAVTLEPHAVCVDISPGRWVRPLWHVRAATALPWLASCTLEQALPRLPPLAQLIADGLIEYVDPDTDAVIATCFADLLEECTHVEMEASLLLGESAAHIPFVQHTPAPRVSFQAGMAQQTVDMLPFMLDGQTLNEYRLNASWETTHVCILGAS